VKLAAGLVLILVAVEELVGRVESLGATFGVPEFLAGVTVIAAATSLPDALVSVRSARDARGATSLGNVLGSKPSICWWPFRQASSSSVAFRSTSRSRCR
jgi:cation:H+ antiporter